MENSKFKILVVGIGGVGGYFGGLLAKKYEGSASVEINFLSRGASLQAIQKDGLIVREGIQEYTARPHLAVDNVEGLPKMDLVIVATKTYGLKGAIEQVQSVIRPDTIVLPLLNGVDSKEVIQEILPETTVFDGCVYIISKLGGPGIIEKTGKYQALNFGLKDFPREKITFLNQLFLDAGIESYAPEDIAQVVWQKYIFIASVATATSLFDCTIDQITNDPTRLSTTRAMIDEVIQVGQSFGVNIRPDMTDSAVEMMLAVPPGNTSSMHRDFIDNRKTELESLTGHIVRTGKANHIPTPRFEEAYQELKNR